MADNDISVESVEVTLRSEISMSSAIMMKTAYLPATGEKNNAGTLPPQTASGDFSQEAGLSGPNARVYITKIANLTPVEEIGQILSDNPDWIKKTSTHDLYSLILTMSLRLGDLSTSHFINGTLDLLLPEGVQILAYSPKERGIISSVIEDGGDTISISPGSGFVVPATKRMKNRPGPQKKGFRIPVGPDETIALSYRKKSGYSFDMPARLLLEYQGMLKNEHEMYWEIYPPMPPNDVEIAGKDMLVVIFLVLQAPLALPPEMNVRMECRVKGDLWGVIPIRGSVVL